MRNLLAKKPLEMFHKEAASSSHSTLKRTLGPVDLITFGVGIIVGAGIFVLTGAAAAQFAGPAIILSFVIAAIACASTGLCYAEFASLLPMAGSAYSYGYATLGELFAWIIGWDLILEYGFGGATVASGWAATVSSFCQSLGIYLPPRWTDYPGRVLVFYHNQWIPLDTLQPMVAKGLINPALLPHVTTVCNLLALVVVAVVTAVLVVGIRQSANFTTAVVFAKLAAILVFIVVAGTYVLGHRNLAASNWQPFIPINTGTFGRYGVSGVIRGAAVVFFAYLGFDSVSTAAQEAKNPQRDMPIGILGSLVLCTVLYILVAGLVTAVVPYSQLNVAAPVSLAINSTGVRWGGLVANLGAILGLSSASLVCLLGGSRIVYSMSKDGLLPGWGAAVHPRFRTPWISTIMLGIFIALFAALIPVGTLGQLVNIGTLLAFVIVCAGVLMLRTRHPDLPRPFRTPWVPFIPAMGMVISFALMTFLPRDTWMRLVVWLAIGLSVYFAYGYRHSRVQTALTTATTVGAVGELAVGPQIGPI